MIVNRIKELILKYLREEISDTQRLELDIWLAESPDNQLLFEEVSDPVRVAEALAKMDALHEDEVWDRINGHGEARWSRVKEQPNSAPRRIGRYWRVAVAIVLLLGAGGYLWQQRWHSKAVPLAQAPAVRDLPPGSNKAVLTLGNGTQVLLDSAHDGTLAEQGNTTVVKTDSGRLAYNITKEKPTAVLYNTLATPRGGQYQLMLPDGTKAWLNAASSIRYPTDFIGPERRVEVSGEVYFEVSKNAFQPFKVSVDDQMEVGVLGTSFNINAYEDEEGIKTTLLEGSVNVRAVSVPGSNSIVGVKTNRDKLSVLLKPGQQAQVVGLKTNNGSGNTNNGSSTTNNGSKEQIKVLSDVDVAGVVAWKNGLFAFSNADLPTVMRQLARWYNVDVSYEGSIPKDEFEFSGEIGKRLTLDQVLKVLTKTRVHYTIDGNKLTIRP